MENMGMVLAVSIFMTSTRAGRLNMTMMGSMTTTSMPTMVMRMMIGGPLQVAMVINLYGGMMMKLKYMTLHGDPPESSTVEPTDDVFHAAQEEVTEAERSHAELQALVAERSLLEARKAVAAAARDRGWQQRQQKSTSVYMNGQA